MRFILITGEEHLLNMMGEASPDDVDLLITDNPILRKTARGLGFRTSMKPFSDPDTFSKLKLTYRDRVLVHLKGKTKADECLSAIFTACNDTPVTVFNSTGEGPEEFEELARFVSFSSFSDSLRSEVEMSASMRSVTHLRRIFENRDKVLLLLQDDPDPDGIASALALRAIIGRNRISAPIGAFGQVTRPENVAMTKHLDIVVNTLTEEDLKQYDAVALLDVQPYHSPLIPLSVDAVIDHHPKRSHYTSLFKDIRPRYGATSTIMTQYLLASKTPISQRLATALLYGIKTDTQLLGRDTTPMDVAAFATLYPMANQATMRRIDRPQIPRDDLNAFSIALQESFIDEEVIYAHMGPLTRDDVIPYFADLCLEVENVQWSVASGIFDGNLIISIRTYGESLNAGEVTKTAFEIFGSAGGHRAMSKAVIPLSNIPVDAEDHEQWIKNRFKSAMESIARGEHH